MVGCEWESANSDNGGTWNDRYSWVNFSGMYSAANNSALVISSGTGTVVVIAVRSEVQNQSAVAGQSAYSGTLDCAPVIAGSFQISVGVFALTDDGAGVLAGGGKTGTIDYGTGAWTIDLLGEWPPAGADIIASYNCAGIPVPDDDDDDDDDENAIYSFVVSHQGNLLHITDSNGSVYNGMFSGVRTTGNIDQDTVNPSPMVGEQVVANFTADGVSMGQQVHIVGIFSGVVQGQTGALSLGNRQIMATWIESEGRTTSISAQSLPVGISASPAVNTPTNQMVINY
jgi:hypothetical protein